VPIVVISAYSPSEQVQRLNPAAYLDKPCQLDDLFSTVERVLARA
jgi:two-component SAPR family response regulator